MRHSSVHLAVLASCATLALSCSPATTPEGSRSPDSRTADGPRSKSETAPDFTVETFAGERFSLGEQQGTPVVLNFWESW